MSGLVLWHRVVFRSLSRSMLLLAGCGLLGFVTVAPLIELAVGYTMVPDILSMRVPAYALAMSLVGLLFFGLLSLELGRVLAPWNATSGALRVRGGHDALARWLALLLVLLLVLVVLFHMSVTLLYAQRFGASVDHRANLTQAILLNVGVPCAVGMVLGLVLSRSRNRSGAYAVLLLVVLLMSPIFSDAIAGFVGHTQFSDISRQLVPAFMRLVALAAPESSWVQDPGYRAPVEVARWLVAACWIGVLVTVLWLQRRTERWVGLGFVLAVSVALAFVWFTWLDSVPRHDRLPASAASGLSDLAAGSKPAPAPGISGSARVGRYDMNLRIGRRLDADVTVEVQGLTPTSQRVVFTLFRGYRVRAVTDGAAAPLAFTQQGDVVSVSRAPDDVYRFDYVGSGWNFYSNHQGTFLPATFPYYPWLGIHRYWSESGETFSRSAVPTATFSVEVVSRRPACSNFGWIDSSGKIEGESSGLTLVSGDIVAEQRGGWTVISARDQTIDLDREQVVARVAEASGLLGIAPPPVPRRRTFFFASTMAGGGWHQRYPAVVGDQSIGVDTAPAVPGIVVPLVLDGIPSENRSNGLYLCLQHYLEDPGRFRSFYEQQPQAIDAGQGVVIQPDQQELFEYEFAHKIDDRGEKRVLRAAYRYLLDPSALDPSAFVSGL